MDLQNKFEQQGNRLFRNRGWLPILILVPGALIFWREQVHGTFISENHTYLMLYEMICLFVGLAGLFVRAYTVGHAHPGTSGRNTDKQSADTINTTGIYSVVRHPLYLGNFLMWLGVALLTENVWFIVTFCLLFCIYYERIMFAEEQFLKKKFKDVFLRWADQTPAFFPRFGQFVKPDRPFDLMKAMKAEKNGLLALFTVFFAFDFSGAAIRGDHHRNYVLMIGFIVSAVFYLIMKYLKHKTNRKRVRS